MSLEKTTEVLVVGAGPVGMITALLLAEQGVDCTVIDAKGGPAARSYACALHPRSLEVFDRLGLLQDILPLGRRFETVAFYDGKSKRAEISLSELPAKFPYLLVLPQNALERLLEAAIRRRGGMRIHWHHQLSEFKLDDRGIVAAVDRLAGSASGYIVPHWEMVIKGTDEIRAAFLIGADGHNSLVRQRLGIDYERVGGPEFFAVFEFETEGDLPDEIRVVLNESTTNVLWPLANGRCRWSFQIAGGETVEDFPDKERRAVWIDDPERNHRLERDLQAFIWQRAPWFEARVKEFDWASRVHFERRLVQRFGTDPCWLAGDSAHQTGPVGVQSLNIGLLEAAELAEILKARLQDDAPAEALKRWEQRWRNEWKRLFGLNGALAASAQTDQWVQQHADKILPCLPAFGEDLGHCLKQLHLAGTFASAVARA